MAHIYTCAYLLQVARMRKGKKLTGCWFAVLFINAFVVSTEICLCDVYILYVLALGWLPCVPLRQCTCFFAGTRWHSNLLKNPISSELVALPMSATKLQVEIFIKNLHAIFSAVLLASLPLLLLLLLLSTLMNLLPFLYPLVRGQKANCNLMWH